MERHTRTQEQHGDVKIVAFRNRRNITILERHIFEDHFSVINDSSLVSNNMADVRIGGGSDRNIIYLEAQNGSYVQWNVMRFVG